MSKIRLIIRRKCQFVLVVINLLFAIVVSLPINATIVQFETNFGNFEINLYDQATPQTVANFLQYVNDGDYANSIVHRAESNFVIQGGGFAYDTQWPASAIASDPAVTNEPVYSNVRGTIAMAKLGGNPNSATNQWFINLSNNASNLDLQNGGFTVFGEVVSDGMNIVDEIANQSKYNLGGAFTSIPLQNYDTANDPDDTNLVIITSIQIIDATADTAAGLNPPAALTPEEEETASSSGGGSFDLGLLSIFTIFAYRLRKSRYRKMPR